MSAGKRYLMQPSYSTELLNNAVQKAHLLLPRLSSGILIEYLSHPCKRTVAGGEISAHPKGAVNLSLVVCAKNPTDTS